MNKLILGLVTTIILIILCFYHPPIISSDEAIAIAEKHLLNLPDEWKNSISLVGLGESSTERVGVRLLQKQGFWNGVTNKMQWEITLKYADHESTIIIDAYTGEFIDMIGALN